MKSNCCWVNYKWDIIQNQIFIRNKVKVLSDFSNYTTKKELKHAAGVDASDLAAKKVLLL